jgi:hypothetical protein
MFGDNKNRDNMPLTGYYGQQKTQLNGFLCIYGHAINCSKQHSSISTARYAFVLLPLLFCISGIRNTWHLIQYILQYWTNPSNYSIEPQYSTVPTLSSYNHNTIT